ncbi:MAG: (Fe-S)-binding protein [Dehalococcoidia bacterium]|nr:(Fe-S)-binding protein [Dehalococcoidia bacterium]
MDPMVNVPSGRGPGVKISEQGLFEVDHCSRCGFCLPVCPTYRETGLEVQSPRGRVQLIRSAARGELAPEAIFEHLYHCLDCRACETVCPSGVHPGQRVVEARAALEPSSPIPWYKRLVLRWVLPSHNRQEFLFLFLKLYVASGLQRLARSGVGQRLVPGPLRRMEDMLPKLPAKPLRQRIKEVTPAEGERRARVGFFLGCVMNILYADASAATLRVMTRNGCEVVTPRVQRCCGAPHQDMGDWEGLRDLARHNIEVFERAQVDYIVADCAACSGMNKEYAEILAGDPDWAERARAHAAKTRDITELLAQLPLKRPFIPLERKVTYHEPCHLRHAQGVASQPRQVLEAIPGLQLVELRESDWCCGSAGVYNITHPERSQGLLQRKLDHIAATGADTVVTGNPGCLLQLQQGLRGAPTRVMHITELLDEAYRAEEAASPGASGKAQG